MVIIKAKKKKEKKKESKIILKKAAEGMKQVLGIKDKMLLNTDAGSHPLPSKPCNSSLISDNLWGRSTQRWGLRPVRGTPQSQRELHPRTRGPQKAHTHWHVFALKCHRASITRTVFEHRTSAEGCSAGPLAST